MLSAYKGYTGSFEYSLADKCFHGRVQGIRDVVNFEADIIENLQKEFETSVEDYLEACADWGQEPQKPKSGKLAVRIAPEIHEMVANAANNDAKSINQWIAEVLEKAARERLAAGSIKIRIK